MQILRIDLNLALKNAISLSNAGWQRGGFRSGLIVAQIALSLVLLSGAGLLLRSFRHLIEVNPGFNAAKILAMDLTLTGSQFDSDDVRMRFIAQVRERVAALPGVQSAATVHGLPFGGMLNSFTRVVIDGRETAPDDSPIMAGYRQASPGYFRTMQIPFLEGRDFTERDTTNAPEVVIINEAFAKKYFPGGDALGKRLNVAKLRDSPSEIVGIVRDVKLTSLDAPSKPEVYLSHLQKTVWMFSIVARTDLDGGTFAREVQRELDEMQKGLPVYNVRTLDQAVQSSLAPKRLAMWLLVGFGSTALSLAAIGIYGVISWMVTQRTRELGIRVALGAQKYNVLGLVLSEGARLVLIGLSVGGVASLILTRFLQSFLYQIRPDDPFTLLGVSLLLAITALLACWLPARRAAQVDPMEALRCE
jgi:predicted permease